MCFSITLITLFTHSIFHSEKQTKNPPHLPISGKFYFQPSLKSGSLFTLLEKEKKKKNKDLGHLQKRWLVVRVLWRSPGALTTWGAERLKGSGLGRQRQKESAGRLRPQLNPGVRERREEAIETEVKVRT